MTHARFRLRLAIWAACAACIALAVPSVAHAQRQAARKQAKTEVRRELSGKKLYKDGKPISKSYRTMRPIRDTGAYLGSNFGRLRTKITNSPINRIRDPRIINFRRLTVLGEKGSGGYSRVKYDKSAGVILGERDVKAGPKAEKRRGWTVVNPKTGEPYPSGRFYKRIRSTESGHLIGRKELSATSEARGGDVLLNSQGRPITKPYKLIEERRIPEGLDGKTRKVILGYPERGPIVELSSKGEVLGELR